MLQDEIYALEGSDPTPNASAASSHAPVTHPELTCPNGYKGNPYPQDIQRGWRRFDELSQAPPESFQDLGAKANVERHIYTAQSPTAHGTGVCRGVATFNNVTPLEVFSCIYNPGYRLIWDHRISAAYILERFSQTQFLFYLVTRGIGPVYWPRDAVGIQGARFYKRNGEVVTDHISPDCDCIDLIWTSLETSPVSPQEGKVRAFIDLVGYRLQKMPDGGCRVTYLLSLDLAVPIPGYIRKTLLGELPLSLARLRDAIPTFGVSPYVIDESQCLALQRHFFDAESRKTHVLAFAVKAGTAVIVLDIKRMYPSGIMMPTIEGPGAGAVSVQEAITGDRLFVHVDDSALRQLWTLSFEPRDKEPEPNSSEGWW